MPVNAGPYKASKQVLDFITRYIEDHGSEPSYQMIARAINVRSKAGVAKHVQALENQGLLTKRRENGTFTLDVHTKDPAVLSVTEIEWLELPESEDFKEDWLNEPLFVPKFMLGIYVASKIFAFRIPDDAMYDRGICEGDITLIEKRTFVRDSDCVAALIDEKTCVLRAYHRDGSKIELRAANERFETITLPADRSSFSVSTADYFARYHRKGEFAVARLSSVNSISIIPRLRCLVPCSDERISVFYGCG